MTTTSEKYTNVIVADGYSEDHITFKWENDITDGMSFVPSNKNMLPQYSLATVTLTTTFNQYVVGEYYYDLSQKVNLLT